MTLFSGDPKVGLGVTWIQSCWNTYVDRETKLVLYSKCLFSQNNINLVIGHGASTALNEQNH